MKTKKHISFLFVYVTSLLVTSVLAQTTKDYRSMGTGVSVDLATATNWEYYDGTNWITATQAPFATGTYKAQSGNTITIESADTWNCSANVTVSTGANIDFKGITGSGFGSAVGQFKVTLNSPSTVTFSGVSGTIPYSSYANITIPAGSSYTYSGGTMQTAWASSVTIDGVLTLNTAASNYFTIGTAPLSQVSIGSSYLLGSGTIDGTEKFRFGGDATTTKPIISNFTGSLGLATTGVIVNGTVQLAANMTTPGMVYWVNAAAIDLNGYTLQAKSLNGIATNIKVNNTIPGNLVVTSNAAGLGSIDGLPFYNVTLTSGTTVLSSNISVNHLFTNAATLSATSAQTIHIPSSHADLGGIIDANVTVLKDILGTGISSKYVSANLIYKVEKDFIAINNAMLSGIIKVRIVDIKGKTVFANNIYNNSRIFVGSLKQGVYVVSVINNNREFIQKYIK